MTIKKQNKYFTPKAISTLSKTELEKSDVIELINMLSDKQKIILKKYRKDIDLENLPDNPKKLRVIYISIAIILDLSTMKSPLNINS